MQYNKHFRGIIWARFPLQSKRKSRVSAEENDSQKSHSRLHPAQPERTIYGINVSARKQAWRVANQHPTTSQICAGGLPAQGPMRRRQAYLMKALDTEVSFCQLLRADLVACRAKLRSIWQQQLGLKPSLHALQAAC